MWDNAPLAKRHRMLLAVITELDASEPGGHYPLGRIIERFCAQAAAERRLWTETQNHSEASRALRHLYQRSFVRAQAGSYGLTAAGCRMAAFLAPGGIRTATT